MQHPPGAAAHVAQSFEYEFEVDGAVFLVVAGAVAPVFARQPPGPAAVVVFDAADVVEEAVVAVRVVAAVEQPPLRVDAPGGGEGGLVVVAAVVVVREVDETVAVEVVVEADDVAFVAVFLGVPVGEAVEAPVLVNLVEAFADEYGATLFFGGLVAELDATVFEVLDLAEREAQFFLSVVVAVEAAADGGGELVGVADAVFANEAVAREEPVPGEAAFVGVKVGDFALVFVGGVEVVQARLQRLCPVFALPAEVALEGEFAVQAEGRQEAVVVFAAQLVLARAVVVMGVVGADLRLDVAVGGLKTVSGADVAAVAVGSAQFVLVEVDGFGIDVVAPVAVFEGVVVGELL